MKLLFLGLVGTFIVAPSLAWSQTASVAILDCADAQTDKARLKCYDGVAAKLRNAKPPAVAAAAPTKVTPPAVANASTGNPAADSGSSPVDANFGLQGDALRKAQERASPPKASDRKKPQLVAVVSSVSRRPGFPMTVVLVNGQVWEELEQGSNVLISRNDPVKIKAGVMGSFFLTDVTNRTIRVRRVE